MEKKDSYKNKIKSGFVAIVGLPNAGKSTLLNNILEKKISITSKKPRTTRNSIFGELTEKTLKIIFVDTPGISKCFDYFNYRLIKPVYNIISSVDLILFVVDITSSNIELEKKLLSRLAISEKPIFLVINKIDKVRRNVIYEKIKNWSDLYEFNEIIPTSAIKKIQIEKLVYLVKKKISFFSTNFIPYKNINVSKKFIISEIIREKIFRLTGKEIPYSVAVVVDQIEDKINIFNKKIYATIYVEHSSQKMIILGKNGNKIKKIGIESRLEISKLLKIKVMLILFVKVQKNWTKDLKILRKFGY